ncbi:uncharacterized protein HKW66_Vig0253140 [Vigna angularis]|uniref:Uncharacterized protein n=1 Tax=Phaseolus angularis TaxID=3914 RepID=A0A8T0K171_PHAAN|nr:uncharacterized protein HKW66_Vig0253140 [Vigna angularis]
MQGVHLRSIVSDESKEKKNCLLLRKGKVVGCEEEKGGETKKKLGYGLLPPGVDEEEAGLQVHVSGSLKLVSGYSPFFNFRIWYIRIAFVSGYNHLLLLLLRSHLLLLLSLQPSSSSSSSSCFAPAASSFATGAASSWSVAGGASSRSAGGAGGVAASSRSGAVVLLPSLLLVLVVLLLLPGPVTKVEDVEGRMDTGWESVDGDEGEGLLKKVKNIEYIPEQPDWTTYRDPTPASPPPSIDEYSPRNTESVPSVPSGGTSSSRGSKRKAPLVDVVDAHFSGLRTSLDGFTDALTSSNVHLGVISNAAVEQVSTMKDRNEILRSQTEILRRTPNYTYTEADIYDMLSGMQISDETLLEQCYDFLCSNPTCVKRLMGLPPHKRWNKLCKMYSGGN